MRENLRIVLVETTHPGNIGAVARAMKNMCLRDLVLVAPHRFPDPEATARASGADSVLATARVVPDLDTAVSDCVRVFGCTARLRSVSWPRLDPRACAAQALDMAAQGPVALVFGRESSGLSNAELDRCHALVNIPANAGYSSLNLGMAVQILAYELMLRSGDPQAGGPESRPAPAGDLEGFFRHLEQALEDMGFTQPERADKLLRRLRRLYLRAAPDVEEVNILRGILSACQGRKSMRRPDGG